MKKLILMPVLSFAPAPPRPPLALPEPTAGGEPVALWLSSSEGLAAGVAPGDAAPVAELMPLVQGGELSWWLAPRAPELLLNGAMPLPLAALSPGDLLAVGGRWWYVTVEWVPEMMPAPAELADRPCPVCGGALSLAPVCRCRRGRGG